MNTQDNIVFDFPVPAVKVRFRPTDTEETFVGIVIGETEKVYVVILDDNVSLVQRWNKNHCDVLR
jgi:hypothetical protein